ncbi:hypothetical protein JOF41_000195 [Saccharothrix coeruleofusca]|uniref:hypothetical protein n=1 Tax=Saccharothrix coeruleofusca TaxID=33919 RepID=UPI001AE97268|nr:hypothetical protein [Saccharothrix coeruleofusca]MBP2334017.1 hypothetical protein [Saccharothrix coeruleofusca]
MSDLVDHGDLEVEINHGQVYIYSAPPWRTDPNQANAMLHALDDAQNSGRYVGVSSGLVDLVVPTHWNFNAPMRVEVWTAEPPPDDDNWDNVVDVDLDITDDTLHFQGSGGRPPIPCAVPSGAYRARIAGRGYDQLRADVEGMDDYRLQLWPRESEASPTLRKSWPGWNAT